MPFIKSPGVALYLSPSSGSLPLVETISPLSRKASDTRIAWDSKPPGLFRKSMTTPFIFSNPPALSNSLSNPSRILSNVLSLNVVTRITTLLPSVRTRAAVSLIKSLMIVTSKGSSSPSRTTVMIISEPTGPRMRSTASFRVNPSTLSPSTCVMKSPASMPASSAGVPSIGETTLTNPSS